ncbi:MAG: hypothetical protein H7A46_07755 [Verrucomicrobiales bacterium]|nr:hypothetical protein [Verrucomicrobiales bacterium]
MRQPTRRQIAARLRQFEKTSLRWVFLGLALLVTGLGAGFLLDGIQGGNGHEPPGVAVRIIPVLGCLGAVAAMLLPAITGGRRHRLRCPKCRADLVGNLGYVAVATGNCGHCGEPVALDPLEPAGRRD